MDSARLKIKASKFRIIDLLVIIILVLALGFRTNYIAAEKNISTIGIVILYFALLLTGSGRIIVSKSKKYIFWYTLVVLICAISRFWSSFDINDYIYALLKDTYIPLVFIILTMEYYIFTTKDGKRLMDLLIIAELITVLRVIIHTPWNDMLQSFDSRLFGSGLGQNYNDFTTQMTLISIILAYLGFHIDSKYKKWFWILAALILVSGSRKSIVISVLGYIACRFLGSGHNFTKIIKRAIPIVIIIAIGTYLLLTNDFLYEMIGSKLVSMIQSLGLSSSEMRTTIDVTDIDHSMHGRAVLRELAWNTFLNNPIVGIGYYGFQFTNSYGLYAHNNYLELLADVGIVGFTVYYSMYFRCITECIGKHKKNPFYRFVLIFIFCLIVMEYAQITFFRLFALVPFLAVMLWKDYFMIAYKGENCVHTNK